MMTNPLLVVVAAAAVALGDPIDLQDTYEQVAPATPEPVAPEPTLFFSRLVEGRGFNKQLEIFNPTSENVAADDIQIRRVLNGLVGGKDGVDVKRRISGFTYSTVRKSDPRIRELVPQQRVTICEPDGYASKVMTNADKAKCNLFSYDSYSNGRSLLSFNGMDGDTFELLVNGIVVDVIGAGAGGANTARDDPSVCGVANGLANSRLVRKASVKTGNPVPFASFGSNKIDCEWEITAEPKFDFSSLPQNPVLPSCVNDICRAETPFKAASCPCGGGCKGPNQTCMCEDTVIANYRRDSIYFNEPKTFEALLPLSLQANGFPTCTDFCYRDCQRSKTFTACVTGCVCDGGCTGNKQLCTCDGVFV